MSDFTVRRRAAFSETDAAGLVHFSRMFCYAEDAEHAFFRSLGFPLSEAVEGHRYAWPRVNSSCDFQAPLRWDEEFEVSLTVSRLGKSSITFTAHIDTAAGRIAELSSTSVCCRLQPDGGLSKVEIPAVLRKALES